MSRKKHRRRRDKSKGFRRPGRAEHDALKAGRTGFDGKEASSAPFGCCETCGAALGKAGGFGDTGLCGPCCTGEAATLDEFGETW